MGRGRKRSQARLTTLTVFGRLLTGTHRGRGGSGGQELRGVSSLAWPLPFTQEPLPRCWCQVLGVGVCEALARCPAPAVSGRSIRHPPSRYRRRGGGGASAYGGTGSGPAVRRTSPGTPGGQAPCPGPKAFRRGARHAPPPPLGWTPPLHHRWRRGGRTSPECRTEGIEWSSKVEFRDVLVR